MQHGFEIGDYVIVAHPGTATDPSYEGETFVVKGFGRNTLGQAFVQVSRPENRDEDGYDTLFYPHELELEDWRAARDED